MPGEWLINVVPLLATVVDGQSPSGQAIDKRGTVTLATNAPGEGVRPDPRTGAAAGISKGVPGSTTAGKMLSRPQGLIYQTAHKYTIDEASR